MFRKVIFSLMTAIMAVSIAACSKSGGGSSALLGLMGGDQPPTHLTYHTTSAVYTLGVPITDNEPSVQGVVTSWSVDPALPAGLEIDPFTGIISGTPNVEQTATSYVVTASNDYGSVTVTISITVNLAAPTALSYGTTSCVYTRDLAITDNEPTVTGTVTSWEVSPALPHGLTLGTDGVISGTPDTEQTATGYTITARNAYGFTTATISITVNLAAPAALSYGTTSCVYTKDLAITDNEPTVTGTVATWEVDPALPNGLALGSDGVISGTPDVEQPAANYTITASNSGGSTTTTISIAVNLAAPTALSYATTSCVYTKDLVIADNEPTVTGTVTAWEVEPALPSGLILNTTTGVISGTPASNQSATDYTVTASNSGGSTSTTISITINLAAPTALSYATTSCVYTKDLVITSNEPSVTGTVTAWDVDPALPHGLTLGANGVISGTPDTEQTATGYTITASNSGGSTTATISITVNLAAPTALSYSVPNAVYTKDLVITNNSPTVTGTVTTWEVDPALPSGLTMGSNGVISGTPDVEQPAANYTITASNSGGSTTVTIVITVNLSAPTALSYTIPSAVYTRDLVIADNEPTVTGTVTAWDVDPALPHGLTLGADGVISGTPDTEQAVTSYTITASNSGGSTTATISITVNLAAPSGLSYSNPSAIYNKDAVISDNIPTVTGTVATWEVAPALPHGLTLGSDGVISGTPDTEQTATAYTITASNTGGSTTATISIAVKVVTELLVDGRYAAGYYHNGSANIACLWNITDTTPVRIDLETSESMAAAAVVSGSTVYVVGTYDSNACYWKINGDTKTRIDLNGTAPHNVNDVEIIGTDMYISGATDFMGSGMQACYWKVNLTDDSFDNFALSGSSSLAFEMTESGGVLYISGTATHPTLGTPAPYYWSVVADVPTAHVVYDGFGNGGTVLLDGTDVVVGGWNVYEAPFYMQAVSWTYSGSPVAPTVMPPAMTTPDTSAVSASLNATGGIYYAGTQSDGACYWLNGTEYDLVGAGLAGAYRVKQIDTDMYFAGHTSTVQTGSFPTWSITSSTASVWKKRGSTVTRADLATSATGNAEAWDVFEKGTITPPETYAITYEGNGNTGGEIPIDPKAYKEGETLTILGNTGTLEKSGFYFTCWNSQQDGNGTNYFPGNIFTMETADVILHAKWVIQGSPGSLYTYFDPGTGADDYINAVAVQSDGKIILGGSFTLFNGTDINRIVRLNIDGSIDSTFDTGSGANNRIGCITIQSDGKILIGGSFSSYNGTTIIDIARLNSDGTLDTSFNQGTGPMNIVSSIAVQDDGKILIGGDFPSYNGTSRMRIARLNSDGSLDFSFDPGTGANSSVKTIKIQSDGKIIIGGFFTTYNGVSRNYIARLNPNGSLDTSLDSGTMINGGISSLAIQTDGKIVIGGSFDYNFTQFKNRIARLNSDGSLDSSFDPGTGANSSVGSVAIQSDGKIIIGGAFTTFNGTTSNYIARINSNGSVDTTFNVGTGANYYVRSLCIQDDGRIFIVGEFSQYNGTSRNRIASIWH